MTETPDPAMLMSMVRDARAGFVDPKWDELLALVDDQASAIQRVRELHAPVKSLNGFGPEACKGCSDLTSLALGYENWVVIEFCPTIRALDGENL